MEKTVKRKKWLPWAIAIFSVLVLFFGIRLYRAFYDRKVPNFSGTYEFYVRPGM